MEKIYGYKEKDVIGLAEFIFNKGTLSLSSVFERYSAQSGKAKGTVRNLYYALAKHSQTDEDFCAKYLGGKPLSVSKIVEFDKGEEKKLVKKILAAKSQGRSARSAIMELAGGDGKIALRYQNKYRNAVKNKPELIEKINCELKEEGFTLNEQQKPIREYISDIQFNKLKGEINNLVSRIALKTKKENEFLKERIAVLERENLKLYSLLYGENKSVQAIKYFRTGGSENIIN